MMQSGLSYLQGITADLDITQKSISAAKVILTGFVVVFAMLILLILIIKLYGAIIAAAQKSGDKRAQKKKKITEPVVKKEISKPIVFSTARADEDEGDIPEEVIAVISAAVASMYGSTGKTRIKSIKKSSGGRSAWANAGVLENTRPF